MNGSVNNTRYVDLSTIKDIKFNGISIIDENKNVELKQILEGGLNSLLNYYDKTELYTKEEINNLITNRQGYKIVDSLPTADISPNIIYLLIKTNDDDSTDADAYDEYIYINSKWEHVGSFQADFSDYYNKEQVVELLNQTLEALNTEFEAIKQGYENLKTHVGAIDDVLDAINGEVVQYGNNK